METIESIRHAARRLVRELHLLDSRYCIEGLSFSECHLVTELDRLGHATASELAELLVLEKSTISRLVKGLTRQSLLQAKVDPGDRRKRRLSLTDAGKDSARRVHRHARQQVGSALDFVAGKEVPVLTAGLERYASAMRYARLAAGCTIRPIRPADDAAVAGIIRQVMTEYGAVGQGYSIQDPEVDAMTANYPPPRARFWVIERGGRILGCGGIAPLAGGPDHTCELRKMYFLPEARGLGLGTRLMNLCLDAAREAGYRCCYLETLASMEGARHLYRKHGFTDLTGPMGCTGHSGCNAWMSLPLADPAEPITGSAPG